MEPIFGMVLYAVACAVVWVVASKRGRPGWAYGLGAAVGGLVLVLLTSSAGGSGLQAGWAAFAGPLAGLLLVLASPTGDALAASQGQYRGMRRCPHCAESIKAAAAVCKHCGRDVPPAGR